MKTLKPQEVFEYLNDEFIYIAMHSDGGWVPFRNEPTQQRATVPYWYDKKDMNQNSYRLPLNIDYTGDWKDSLHCREQEKPEQKPSAVVNCFSCGGFFKPESLVFGKTKDIKICINCATRIDSKNVWIELHKLDERINNSKVPDMCGQCGVAFFCSYKENLCNSCHEKRKSK